jgi:hypothetical protein
MLQRYAKRHALSDRPCRRRSSPSGGETPAKEVVVSVKLERDEQREKTHVVVVRVGREGVADLLRGRLLALGLERGRGRVSVALELVAEVLGRRLLRVGLEGGAGLVGEALAGSW